MGMRAKLKMVWNISIMMPRKISSPQTRCVRMRSSLSEVFSPSVECSMVTCCVMANTRA